MRAFESALLELMLPRITSEQERQDVLQVVAQFAADLEKKAHRGSVDEIKAILYGATVVLRDGILIPNSAIPTDKKQVLDEAFRRLVERRMG